MTEVEILAHAEALANQRCDLPTEEDFLEAEAEVRARLDDDEQFHRERGWGW